MFYTAIPAVFSKKMVNFGSLTTKLQAWILAHPMSMMHVLCMLMHLTGSHVTATR